MAHFLAQVGRIKTTGIVNALPGFDLYVQSLPANLGFALWCDDVQLIATAGQVFATIVTEVLSLVTGCHVCSYLLVLFP